MQKMKVHFKSVKSLSIFLAIMSLFITEILGQQTEPMRVMSYNVRYKNTIDSINGWEYRRDEVAALIKYHQGDIVGLQEANPEQVRDLEQRLEEYAWYGVPRVGGSNGELTPVFFRKDRYSLLDSGTFWFSETPNVKESKSWDAMFPRIASWCKLKETTTGMEFFFFNTHFDHRGETAREKSAEIIRQQIDSIAGSHPVILTGDFNSQENSVAYQTIVENKGLKDALQISETPHYGPVNTSSGFFVSEKPVMARIDYIFVNNKVKVLQHATITDQQEGRYYSDHLPVIAEIQLLR